MLSFETFFSINLLPFIEIADTPRPLDEEDDYLPTNTSVLSSVPSFNGHRL
jgi:hypothetical protein